MTAPETPPENPSPPASDSPESASTPRGLLGAVTGYGAAVTVGKLASLVAVPAVTWVVAPETLGTFAILNSLALLAFAVLVDFGLDTAALRLGADAPDARRRIFSSLLSARVVLATLVALLVYAAREPLSAWLTGDARHGWAVGWLALSIAVGAPGRTLTNWLRVNERHRAAASAIAALGVIEAVLLVALVVFSHLGLVGLVWARVGSQVASLVVLAVLARDLFGARPRARDVLELARLGLPLGLLYVLYSLREVDRYLVGERASLHYAGVYDLAVRVAAPLAMANFALTMALEPVAYRAHAQAAFAPRLNAFFRGYVVLGCAIAAFASALAPEIVLLFGQQFRAAAIAIPGMLFLEVVEGVRRMSGLGGDLAKRTGLWAIAALVNALVALPLAWWSIPIAPLVAAPASLLLGAAVGAAVATHLAARLHPLRLPAQPALALLCLTAAIQTGVLFVAPPGVVGLALRVAVAAGATLVAMRALAVGPRELRAYLTSLRG